MAAYQIKINIQNTPEQEIFMTFQCSVLSVPVIESDDISFKSQAIEYNGKSRTEIPITCLSSTHNLRIFNKVNKLQKGNKINIMGNLIKNDEEIVVAITYIVYDNNTSGFSSTDKKNLSKIPWLDPSGHKKSVNEDQSHDINDDLPKFILRQETNNAEVINVSDNNDDDTQGIKNFSIYQILSNLIFSLILQILIKKNVFIIY